VLNMQYVQTARAKGLNENVVIWKHAFRNAIHPLIMVLGGGLPALISGETIVALVLNIPTTGPLYFNALLQKDMYLAGAFLVFLALMLLIGNLLADILLAWVDPRIRYE
jgi:peptide/nickel transport system permease protein